MGALAKECGCVDGPWSAEHPDHYVSVRCAEHHNKVPALVGHKLLLRSADGDIVDPGRGPRPSRVGPRMTIPKTRRR